MNLHWAIGINFIIFLAISQTFDYIKCCFKIRSFQQNTVSVIVTVLILLTIAVISNSLMFKITELVSK